MSEVLIVSRTRMRNGRVCVGGHDLDRNFKSVRLLRLDGTNMLEETRLVIGDVWDMDYRDRRDVVAPHVEDVLVRRGTRLKKLPELNRFLQRHAPIWRGPPTVLFDGLVEGTPSGTAYVPAEGRLPGRSTGYWMPDDDLVRTTFDEKVRFLYEGPGAVDRFSWVGMANPPDRIAAGGLVRVSLARLWNPPSAPAGYYVQISGTY